MKRERLLAVIAFATVCVVWGTTYLGIRIAIETLPTFLFAGARFTLAGLILLGICLLRGQRLPVRSQDWKTAAIAGALMIGGGNIAVVWAEHYVASGLAALLVATSPFWMSLLESLRKDGERVNVRKGWGMLIGFSGVAILVAPEVDPASFNVQFVLGVIVLQLGSIAWNLGSVRSKYHPVAGSPLISAALQMLFGGVLVTVIGLARGEAPLFHFNVRTLTAFLYLLIFGSVIGYAAYVYALSQLRTSVVSLHAYINPVVAVVLGWAILDERLGWREVVAMAVIFGGVALVQTGGVKKKTMPHQGREIVAGERAA